MKYSGMLVCCYRGKETEIRRGTYYESCVKGKTLTNKIENGQVNT